MERIKYLISSVLALWIIIGFTSLIQAQEVLIQRQLSLSLAEEAATAAIERCRADGFRVSVAVVDRSGSLKALLRDDDAGPHTLDSSRRKAFTALSFRTGTTELVQLLATNPSAAGLVNISNVLILGGGIPIRAGQEVIGAIGVGGAPGGDRDDICAQAGIDRIANRLK
ncbi:MAG: hypothetical protein A2V86_06095 [Deltaproteobacteria bacterium RBG_16_49_23]|nr:MAG: hypothetical protein A2V86_06095 [Deltaproteobacteria bacterium RBG_16_49_23]